MPVRRLWWSNSLDSSWVNRCRSPGESGASSSSWLPALALAWVLSDPAVNGVVVGPRRPDQLAPALAALDLPLSPAERTDLTRIMPPGPAEPAQPA